MKKEAVSSKTKTVKSARKITRKTPRKVVETTPMAASVTPVSTTVKTATSLPLSTKIIIGVAVAVCAALGFLYIKYWNVAIVNGNPISRISYFKTMEGQIGKQTLSNMITESLVEDAAEKADLKIDDQTVANQIALIETKIKAQGQTLDEALIAEGLTRADLTREIKIQQIVEQLGAGKIDITDKQIDDYITKNQDLFPKTASAAAIRDMAKSQLESETKNTNIQNWLEELKNTATIIYR